MFNSVGWPEVALLIVVALFVFGPERLPRMIADAGRMLRTLRELANNARADLQAELGPELGDLDLAALNPKSFVRQHLFDGEDPLDGFLPTTDGPASRPLADGERAPFDTDAT